MEPRICQDNHLAVTLGNQGVKMRVVDVGGGTVPGTHQPPLIQDETELPAHNPPMITLPFLAHLHDTAPFAHGVEQLDLISIRHAQYGRGCQKPGGPRRVGLEEPGQAGALGQMGKQGHVVTRQPAIEGPGPATFAGGRSAQGRESDSRPVCRQEGQSPARRARWRGLHARAMSWASCAPSSLRRGRPVHGLREKAAVRPRVANARRMRSRSAKKPERTFSPVFIDPLLPTQRLAFPLAVTHTQHA